jgi:hypothetical protein
MSFAVAVFEQFAEEFSHFPLGGNQGFLTSGRGPINSPVPLAFQLLLGNQKSTLFQ